MKKFSLWLPALTLVLVLAGCQGPAPADGSTSRFDEEETARPGGEETSQSNGEGAESPWPAGDVSEIELYILEEETAARNLPPAAGEEAALAAEDEWGLALSVKDVTATGLTLVITQSGGELTGGLNYGAHYFVETLKDGGWEELPYLPSDIPMIWPAIEYLVQMECSEERSVGWKTLYGSLPAGTYRLAKGFSDFRGTGDYDERVYYAEFEIK